MQIKIKSLLEMWNLRWVGLDGVEYIDEDEKDGDEKSHPTGDHLGRGERHDQEKIPQLPPGWRGRRSSWRQRKARSGGSRWQCRKTFSETAPAGEIIHNQKRKGEVSERRYKDLLQFQFPLYITQDNKPKSHHQLFMTRTMKFLPGLLILKCAINKLNWSLLKYVLETRWRSLPPHIFFNLTPRTQKSESGTSVTEGSPWIPTRMNFRKFPIALKAKKTLYFFLFSTN